MRSWRTASVVLLSFSSGLPLGLVWFAIPDWMRNIGMDIRLVGVITLAQAPWAFKVIWSPLMDRFVPPFWGRRRGWMALTQIALLVCGLMLAGVGSHPDTIWVVGAIALATAMASASQDIAYDAYTVDVLRPEEQGAAVGARTAMYRAAMAVSGGAAITVAASWGWPIVNIILALMYLPMLVLTWKAPEPEERVRPPLTLREAVWQPFIGFLSRHRALEILAFVVLYKFSDQLAQALTRPFLIDMGYSDFHRGIALATVGLFATMAGALIGGWITTLVGLGHSLWIFGFLQIFSNVGYFLLARSNGPNLPLMYASTGFELFTSGLGTGAFSVLLLRMTEKRFSATQYALFSSLFALPRLVAGPITGFAVDAMGWPTFYLTTMIMGVPGLLMLARFVPPGVREPVFVVEEVQKVRTPLSTAALAARGILGALATALIGVIVMAALAALKSMTATKAGFDLVGAAAAVLQPASIADWVQLIGILTFGAVGGLFVAAASAARRGLA
ncbi:MAG TPA: MFS transporter [Vicinamibacterales bacterium]|jgi:PAT family beta-lactamase induction signal transducer AmpG|nr:MFS transporter [Vicinamibacterales bacterium]